METIFLKLNSIDLNSMLYEYDHLTAIGRDIDGHEFKIEIEVTEVKE